MISHENGESPEMQQPAVQRLLQNIADTEEEEISCTECFHLVPQFVDLEAGGSAGDDTLPGLQQHLLIAIDCKGAIHGVIPADAARHEIGALRQSVYTNAIFHR